MLRISTFGCLAVVGLAALTGCGSSSNDSSGSSSDSTATASAGAGGSDVSAANIAYAKGQLAKTYEENLREPSYWQGRLDQMTFRGRSVDDVLADPDAIQAITADQVKQVFSKYWAPDNSISVVVVPKGDEGAKPADTSKASAPAPGK